MSRPRPLHWLLDRLGLLGVPHFFRTHRAPVRLAGRIGWAYVLGTSTLTCFLVAAASGISLATVYVPSAGQAYQSLEEISASASGAFLRGMHFYAASGMVALMLLHMARVYLMGAYKFPRQMNWVTGVFLLFLVFAQATSGQLLRWNEDGVWTVAVVANFLARVPLIGAYLAEFALAGPEIGGATLTRFYALHVFILPAGIAALVGLHLYLVIHHGISEPPGHGRAVDKKTYVERYQREKEQYGILYVPDVSWREAVAALVIICAILLLSMWPGPVPLGSPPDPTNVTAEPQPDWFVGWYFALLYLKPEELEGLVMVWAPLLVFVGLLAMPFLFGGGERLPTRRPWAPAIVGVVAVAFATLVHIGASYPWRPAYETRPLKEEDLGAVASAQVLQGARVFHEKGCQYCHRVLGEGGRWAPDLTQTALRVSREEMAARIIMGYGDMPAYQGTLEEGELPALLDFLHALPDAPGGRQGGSPR